VIVFDVSTLIGAALKADSVPERALLRAAQFDKLALSTEVHGELVGVLNRPHLAPKITSVRRDFVLGIVYRIANWIEPTVRVEDCRDAKDDKYLELALAANAGTIVSSDNDLLVLNPWRGVRIPLPSEYLALVEMD